MKTIDKDAVDHIMEVHLLTEDYRQTAIEILQQDDEEQIRDDLSYLDGFCFRSDPAHPGYASKPWKYPQWEPSEA